MAGVSDVSVGDGAIEVLVADAGRILAEALAVLTGSGVTVSSVAIDEPDLEAVFLHLTGKALRD
jgi:ABC-2 type transport system ATP-binding protein